jgi:hypothetical protein
VRAHIKTGNWPKNLEDITKLGLIRGQKIDLSTYARRIFVSCISGFYVIGRRLPPITLALEMNNQLSRSEPRTSVRGEVRPIREDIERCVRALMAEKHLSLK